MEIVLYIAFVAFMQCFLYQFIPWDNAVDDSDYNLQYFKMQYMAKQFNTIWMTCLVTTAMMNNNWLAGISGDA